MKLTTKSEYVAPEMTLYSLKMETPILKYSGQIQELDEEYWEKDW